MTIRFAHFRDWDSNGRLVATIATQELDDGSIAVGVTRCAPDDIPNRKIGRQIAAARLGRFVRMLSGDNHADAIKNCGKLLTYRMPRDAFIRLIIKGNYYVNLAKADRARREALTDMLLDAIYTTSDME